MENVEKRIAASGFNNYEIMPNLVSTVSLFNFTLPHKTILLFIFLTGLFYNKCDSL